MAKRTFLISSIVAAVATVLILSQMVTGGAQDAEPQSAPAGPRIVDPSTPSPIDISLSPSTTPLAPGTSAALQFTATNTTSESQNNLTISFDAPAGITMGTLPANCSQEVNAVSCEIQLLEANQNLTVSLPFSVQPDFPEGPVEVIYRANLGSTFFVQQQLVLTGGSLISGALANPASALPGQKVSLIFSTKNAGLSTISDAVVAVELPDTLIADVVPDDCVEADTGSDRLFTCTLAPLASDELASLTFLTTASSTFPSTGAIAHYGSGRGSAITSSDLGVSGATSPPPVTGCAGCTIRGITYGDPHLITFDGVSYDLQVVGEFVYVEMPEGVGNVQVRTSPWSSGQRVSVISHAAAQLGDNTVEVGPDGQVTVDGIVTEVAVGSELDLSNGASVVRSDSGLTLIWPGTAQRPELRLAPYGTFLNVDLRLPDALAGTVAGLIGNADGNTQNDFSYRNGEALSPRPTATLLHNVYADSWRLSDDESLFTYEDGQSTASFTDLTYPSTIARLSDLTPLQRATAEAICRSFGITDPVLFDACVLDVGLSDGDSIFAAASLNIDPPLLALDGALSSEVVLGDLPLRYYQFTGSGEDALQDSAGSGFDVAIANGTTQTPGPIANEPDFAVQNTLNVWIATADQAGLPAGGDDRTIEFWMNPGTGLLLPVFGYGNMEVYHYSAAQQLSLRSDGVQIASWNTREQLFGSWHHVAITISADVARAYIDGVDAGAVSVSGLTTTLGNNVRIGRLGSFDEVALYDRALTAAEVLEHHAVGRSSDGQPCRRSPDDPAGAAVIASDPLVFYRFDERTDAGDLPRLVADFSRSCSPAVASASATGTTSPVTPAQLSATRSNAAIAYGPTDSFPVGADSRTVEFWMNHGIGQLRDVLTYGDFRISHYGQASQMRLTDASSGATVTWPTSDQLHGTWHHVAITYNGAQAELFIDGAFRGSRNIALDTALTAGMNIGGGGAFDEVSVYDRVLSSAEISEHWAKGALGSDGCVSAVSQGAYSTAVLADEPIRFYRFDDLDAAAPSPRVAIDSGSACVPGAFGIATIASASPAGPAVTRSSGAGPVMFASSAGLPSGGADRTIELWYASGLNGPQSILHYGDLELRQYNLASQITLNMQGSGNVTWGSSLSGFRHVVLSIESGVGTLYVDGTSLGARDVSALNTNLSVGGIRLGNVGRYDELAIYDKALTPAQVQAHYDAAI